MLTTPSGRIIMLFAAFPPAAFSIIQFTILLSIYQSCSISRCIKSLSPSLYQFTFPDIHRIVLEHLFQPFMYHFLRDSLFQHHL